MSVTIYPQILHYKDNNDNYQGINCITGTTFTPHVDNDGYLSWTNNGGLKNPQRVYIKGPQGNSTAGNVVLDRTLSITDYAADAKAVGDAISTKINKPNSDGTLGQVLTNNGNGTTSWTTIAGGNVDVDSTLTVMGQAADAKAAGDRISALEQAIADLTYEKINIISLNVSPNPVEIGSTITNVNLSYSLNKLPKTATLTGLNPSISTTSGTINLTNLSLTENTSWTLTVIDERDETSTRTTTLSFLNKVYWGVGNTNNITNEFIRELANSTLTNSKNRTISINAGTNQYIWYAVPSRLGSCTFTVGGFTGGFSKITTFNYTNASGYSENYDIYKSDNAALGSTSVVIT